MKESSSINPYSMTKKNLIFLLGSLTLVAPAIAAPSLDEMFALRSAFPGVTNLVREPVHGEHVEHELMRLIRSNPRFEFSDEGYLQFKDKIRALVGRGSLGNPGKEQLGSIVALFPELTARKVDALFLAELIFVDQQYGIMMSLVNARNGHVIHSVQVPVLNHLLLDSFARATQTAFGALIKSIPFDGAIIGRQGDQVVLDSGLPQFHPAERVPVCSYEKRGDDYVLDEVGEIVVTRADGPMSFGKIVFEKSPQAILIGNKLKKNVTGRLAMRDQRSSPTRQPAALLETVTDYKRAQGIGTARVSAVSSLMDFTNAGTTQTRERTGFFPGAALDGEVWITSRFFADLGLSLSYGLSGGDSTGGANSQGSAQASGFRFGGGYRLSFSSSALSPEVKLGVGYASRTFQVDPSSAALSFDTMKYSGNRVGADARIPIDEQMGFGFDISTLLMSSFSETPLNSGDTTRISAWEFGFKGYYEILKDTELDIRAGFLNYGADFSGTTSRPQVLLSTSQTAKMLTVGLTKFF